MIRKLAYELRPGMTVQNPDGSKFTTAQRFETINRFDIAFRNAKERNHIVVWPRLAVVEVIP